MKKIIIIACFILLLITTYEVARVFGVFQTIYNDDASFNIAKWHIYVNNEDINGTSSTFYVGNITYTNNEGVSVDRFAPGVTGEFILEIDPTDTEVAFEYGLSVDLSGSAYSQIHIDSITGIDNTNLNISNDVYSRVFTLDEIKAHKVDRIKIAFTWDNDESNNSTDSILGSTGEDFEIPINMTFFQYIE